MRVGHDKRGESVLTHDRKHKTVAVKLFRDVLEMRAVGSRDAVSRKDETRETI